MYEFLQDFAGPLATVFAAGAAAYVAYRLGQSQISIAQENLRATHQRAVLDLFDRRWSIIEEIRAAIGDVLANGTVSENVFASYLRAISRAEFLFGGDVIAYLERMRLCLINMMALRSSLNSDNDAIRIKAADTEADEFTKVSHFYEDFYKLLKPYMTMSQRLPN